jgi:hypothetical protein
VSLPAFIKVTSTSAMRVARIESLMSWSLAALVWE